MHIDPQIGALRGDHAAQRTMRSAVAQAVQDCRQEPGLAAVLAGLGAYGAGAELEECFGLNRLVSERGAAHSLIAPLVGRLVALHRENPLAQLAFRHQSRGGFHFLQLGARGRATLALALHDGRGGPASLAAATFPDAERHEIVLAGRAELALLDIVEDHGGSATIDSVPRRIMAGECLRFAEATQSRIVQNAEGRLLVLRLARIARRPQPTRQFDLATGRLVHRASGDRRESRHEMMMALMGRMGRVDAAPVLAEMARSGSDHLRWQALRECLALDSGTGFDELQRIARSPGDSLFSPAKALRARLVEAHPQFTQKESAPCPA
ncbi:hypothetical protein [Erythrobacter sp.]|uniref:hypothetical protein n=1 Tax=Erythrobacter sp. TaxID=1042 RepID=UPI001B04EBE1|nr:hypothetical protein [Erythrobacter sp.]MBO6527004.1 hypothetical protein [Erythrobacter sp.]MBO6528885.1 hypothetical protein [Erythrobacter sp.]